MQEYFKDMLLDSDRNAQYASAIHMAIQTFTEEEGRSPVVLDAGTGTGFLTACAIRSGAHHVVAVDVLQEHVDKLPHRIRPFQDRVTALHRRRYLKRPVQYDILVSELLGTFSNSESAFKHLSEYVPHMRKSQRVYIIPQQVTQTVRRCSIPHPFSRALKRAEQSFIPTNQLDFLYELADPGYEGEPVVVRRDDFTVPDSGTGYCFSCVLPKQTIPPGTWVAEWVARLWGSVTLENTWEWARGFRRDMHSPHARARAWGLMLFRSDESMQVNASRRVHSMHPMISAHLAENENERHRTQPFDVSIAVKPMLYWNCSTERCGQQAALAEDEAERMEKLCQELGKENYTPAFTLRRHHVKGVVSARRLWNAIDASFPRGLLWQTTLEPILELITDAGLSRFWFMTIDFPVVLPFVWYPEKRSEFDVPVELIAPTLSPKSNRWLTVGALYRFELQRGLQQKT
jgi:SAM-dependent methyltransferase